MLVSVEDGRITTLEGDPKNPATAARVCLKGLAYARRVADPNRLLTPRGSSTGWQAETRRAVQGFGFGPVGTQSEWNSTSSLAGVRISQTAPPRVPESGPLWSWYGGR